MKCRQGQRLLFLLTILLLSATLHAQDLSVMMNGNEEWVSRFSPLEFIMSRPLSGSEHITLVIGTMDVTNLCTMKGDTLSYIPHTFPLPSGSLNISAYVVSAEGSWTSVGNFTLNVLTSTGLEKTIVTPSITLSNKGQLAESHFPETNSPSRKKFQELNGQLSFKMDIERGGLNLGVGFNAVGASFRQEALRFSEKGDDASKTDLASYLIEMKTGRTTISAGHVSHGRHRHLLSGFSSRGISASTAIGTFADLSGAILNGTNIVGWDNFAGLNNPKHRIYSGTLGVEILPEEPGVVRVEASYVHASQLPVNNFNQAQLTDAEKSNGGSVRVLVSNPGRDVTLDAGFTKTRFTNPVDPLLAQGTDIVPVEATTKQARYADVSWDVFRDATILNGLPARLNVAFRHERVDPLYRAVGVSSRSDNLQNTYELRGGVGPVQMDITHLQSEDNLDEVSSVVKTKTRQTGANVVLSPLAVPEMLPSWLPVFSYGLNSTHQFGVSLPTNSDITPDRIPDQLTTSHTTGIEWVGNNLRAAYRGTLTHLDNRQIGRENADAVNRANGLVVSFSPLAQISLNFEGLLESSENTESGSVIRNKRMGASVLAQPFENSTLTLNMSLSGSKPDDGSSRQRQASFSIETSYAFDFSSALVFNWRGQAFVRYSWNEIKSHDNVFNLDTQTRAWVVNTGVSFNIF